MNEEKTEIKETSLSTWAKARLIIAGLLILLLGVFLAMNFTSVPIWLFGFNINMPLVVLALVCFFIGALSGWVGNIMYRRRLEDE